MRKNLNMKLDDNEYHMLKQLGKWLDRSMSNTVRVAVKEMYEREKKKVDGMKVELKKIEEMEVR